MEVSENQRAVLQRMAEEWLSTPSHYDNSGRYESGYADGKVDQAIDIGLELKEWMEKEGIWK